MQSFVTSYVICVFSHTLSTKSALNIACQPNFCTQHELILAFTLQSCDIICKKKKYFSLSFHIFFLFSSHSILSTAAKLFSLFARDGERCETCVNFPTRFVGWIHIIISTPQQCHFALRKFFFDNANMPLPHSSEKSRSFKSDKFYDDTNVKRKKMFLYVFDFDLSDSTKAKNAAKFRNQTLMWHTASKVSTSKGRV